MSTRLKLAASFVALTLASAAFAQSSADKPQRIRGEIVSFDGSALKVHRRSGDTVTIDLQDSSGVNAVKAIQLSDIKPGAYVGTAAMSGPDGKLTAKEVLVFPEAARGTGEGHYAWDLGANSSMTNANVDTVVQGTSGRDLKLSYKGGSNTVTVPTNVPVVTLIPATRAELTTGKKVFVVATPKTAGVYDGKFVVVEKDGVAPPM
ncbi:MULTISPECIES: hypothetical protein [Burkholderia cepacia complex]|uniref:DUF5666 domain-containing protein n=1 Tax=Burkholderia orbicola (strain MC0-3) TaxID=406425 RepID=B1KCC9_BURO0|nr:MULTISPECIES: hypothetical protein [Burkholderia cepacia complex]ACA95876.1 conserved hypothetical protein [Burkholderia orbicola MC0-3]AQQ30963.1 hypothetical protein A8E96_00455 [Burkholderia cenocepacia]MBN3571391.1 hypothetical protein [Burkholderia cenocepacia]MBR7958045.1 hypothetical protein [Burkholderia cenocepacia]MBR8080894.1 hypothetical protein [Burkholderia cenocepacia]